MEIDEPGKPTPPVPPEEAQPAVGEVAKIEAWMMPAIVHLENLRRGHEMPAFPISGLHDLVGGLRPGQLVVIAGRPGAGKTSLALGTATHIAIEQRVPTLVVTFEAVAIDVVQRALTDRGRVDTSNCTHGKLAQNEMGRLVVAATHLQKAPLWLTTKAYCDVEKLALEIKACHAENGLGLVVIDNLQQLTTTVLRDNRHQELVIIVRTLKALAMELGVPFVVCSQVNRNADRLSNTKFTQRVGLRDLADSGACEGEANVVILIHPPDKDDTHDGALHILEVAKNQLGPRGDVPVNFVKEHSRFEDVPMPS